MVSNFLKKNSKNQTYHWCNDSQKARIPFRCKVYILIYESFKAWCPLKGYTRFNKPAAFNIKVLNFVQFRDIFGILVNIYEKALSFMLTTKLC